MSVKSICGVILVSENPQALAEFYASALELAFEKEEHGGLDIHYGVDIGEVHFGIHPPHNLKKDNAGNSTISIAFNINSLEKTIECLDNLGAKQVVAAHDEGFGLVASYLDIDGNMFEIVELTYEFKKA